MPKRLTYGALIAAAVLLGSCDERVRLKASDAHDLADVANANARTALRQNEDQGSKIDDLERKVRDLESMDAAIGRDLQRLQDQIDSNARIYYQHTH